MALEGAFRVIGKVGQWILAFGLVLAALGVIGWLLLIFRLPSQFLLNLGILALPVIFLGMVFYLTAAVLERILARHQPPRP